MANLVSYTVNQILAGDDYDLTLTFVDGSTHHEVVALPQVVDATSLDNAVAEYALGYVSGLAAVAPPASVSAVVGHARNVATLYTQLATIAAEDLSVDNVLSPSPPILGLSR